MTLRSLDSKNEIVSRSVNGEGPRATTYIISDDGTFDATHGSQAMIFDHMVEIEQHRRFEIECQNG
jgi:hypothetical protein